MRPIENLLRWKDVPVCVAVVEVGAEHTHVYKERPAVDNGLGERHPQIFQAAIKDVIDAHWHSQCHLNHLTCEFVVDAEVLEIARHLSRFVPNKEVFALGARLGESVLETGKRLALPQTYLRRFLSEGRALTLLFLDRNLLNTHHLHRKRICVCLLF